jgi:hypothetical protein
VTFGADGLPAGKYGASVFENANAVFIFPANARGGFSKTLAPTIDSLGV